VTTTPKQGAHDTPTKPIPKIEAAMAPFFAAAKKHRLVVQRCTDCGTLRFPARELCSTCLGSTTEWIAVSGRGEIFSYNVMHQVYHPAFADDVPYAVVIVKLAEGPMMTTSLLDCPLERVRIGAAVEVAFEDLSTDVTLPKFRLSGASEQP